MKPNRKPRRKQPRHFHYMPPADGCGAMVRITAGGDSCTYGIREFETQFELERAFQLDKLDIADMATYHVRLLADGSAECCCAGFTYHNACKHADAVAAMCKLDYFPASMIDSPPTVPTLVEGEIVDVPLAEWLAARRKPTPRALGHAGSDATGSDAAAK